MSAMTPDFEQIAQHLLSSIWATEVESERATDIRMIATELRLVWNARGAADIAQLDTAITSTTLSNAVVPGLMKVLDQALRGLDR